MKGKELINIIEKNKMENKKVTCSVAFNKSPYPFLRAFGLDVFEVVNEEKEITILFDGELNDDYTKD